MLPLLIVRNIPDASTATIFTGMADIVGLMDPIWKEYFLTISTFKSFVWLLMIKMFIYIYSLRIQGAGRYVDAYGQEWHGCFKGRRAEGLQFHMNICK